MSSIASPTVSHAHTDVVSEEATDKSEIKERDSAPCESVKSAVTIVPPVANSYVVYLTCSDAESTTTNYTIF